MLWAKRHALMVAVLVLIPIVLVIFSWAEYGYFCDQSDNLNEILRATHGSPQSCEGFWSTAHLHDWIYNMASNWQSDLLIGILLVLAFNKIEGPHGADKEDT
jgi:hypothetical protein